VTRPYTVLSAAVSLDGYLDDAGPERLILSSPADLDRVDGLRASSDAILVGARTVRRDDPRLLVRSGTRRADRVARGLPASPARVVVVGEGPIDPCAAFLTEGDTERVVYCPAARCDELRRSLGVRATVVGVPAPLALGRVLDDLGARGIRRLLVEGGGRIHTQLLQAGLADELQLVLAPVFVGDTRGVRFAGPGPYPWRRDRRATLLGTEQLEDVVLLRYALSDRAVRMER
jgi:5-amino-6-(5-phosphoribosylamino)uracil reductase